MNDWLEQKQRRIGLASGQQRQAADPRRSVWVEASAGTGKTKVLSDRVLRLLLDGTAPGRILCLTYTKAAAVEMSSRIAARLSRWAVAADEALLRELENLLGRMPAEPEAAELTAQARKLFARLLDTPGGMKIQTIHSFCQEILKRFPLEAKISPYFEVMDDRAAKEAIEEVKSRLLLKIEEEPDSAAGQALSYITGHVSEYQFPKLMGILTDNRNKISRLLAHYPSLEAMLAYTAAQLGLAPDTTAAQVEDLFWQRLDRAALGRLIEAMLAGSDNDRRQAVILQAARNGCRHEELYADYRAVFVTKDNSPRKSVATKAVLENCPGAAEWALAEAERILECDNSLAAAALLASTTAVLHLADELIRGYGEYKTAHSKMDYEDLIVRARQLLETPGAADWVLYKLDGGIDHVLIDEAQDTSPDQWAIVKAITDEFFNGLGRKDMPGTVFAVGDRKQSIYSFQGADPAEFERMRCHFSAQLAAGGKFDEVNLAVSFRSGAAVMDAVNRVFADEKARCGVAADEKGVTHTPARIGEGGRVEIWPLIEAEEGENPRGWQKPTERVIAESTSSRLARQIAEKIRQMVESGETLVSQNRPLRYRDFMVLVQRRNSFVEELVRACKNAGVSVAGVDKIRLLEQIAVQDLLGIGKFMLLPEDDLNLAEILKSPLFGLEDEDLFRLAYQRGQSSLWRRLGEAPEYQPVYQQLQSLLNLSDKVRPFELYSKVLNQMEGRKKILARIGSEAEDGLDEFLNLCLRFEQEHVPSLQLFIDWAEKDEVEIKRELEQSEADAVRIMTVHGSKGLQSPVVILPDTVRVKAVKNESGLLLDDTLYYPLSAAEYEAKCKKIKSREKDLSLQEYRRLLYVALTRAEDRLCICGYRQKNKPSEECWYEICRRTLGTICAEEADGTLRYEVKQEAETPPAAEAAEMPDECPVWSWLRENPPAEDPLARPLSPSRPEEDKEEPAAASPIGQKEENRYRRGLLIHRLLQYLPESASADKKTAAREYLRKNGGDLPEREVSEIESEVAALLEDQRFEKIFGPGSKAEVPIMGQIGGRIISGKIDRLAADKKEVWIIDFKTNRPAAARPQDVPAAYRRQLGAYRELVRHIYPGKPIRTLILWTNTARLMEVES